MDFQFNFTDFSDAALEEAFSELVAEMDRRATEKYLNKCFKKDTEYYKILRSEPDCHTILFFEDFDYEDINKYNSLSGGICIDTIGDSELEDILKEIEITELELKGHIEDEIERLFQYLKNHF